MAIEWDDEREDGSLPDMSDNSATVDQKDYAARDREAGEQVTPRPNGEELPAPKPDELRAQLEAKIAQMRRNQLAARYGFVGVNFDDDPTGHAGMDPGSKTGDEWMG
jgi:hypothetical protein